MTFSYALYPTAHSLLNAPIFQLQYIHLTAYSKPTVCLHWIQIDGSKHYIEAVDVFSGCSAGGYMTTRMLIAYPDLFAAAMINCPALDVADARGGETPTDAELASIKNSDTAI